MNIKILNIEDYVQIKEKYYKIVGSVYSDKSKKGGRGRRPILKQLKDKDLRKLIRELTLKRLKEGIKVKDELKGGNLKK